MKKSLNRFYEECKNYKNKQLKLVSVEFTWFFPLIILLIGISNNNNNLHWWIESFKGNIVNS